MVSAERRIARAPSYGYIAGTHCRSYYTLLLLRYFSLISQFLVYIDSFPRVGITEVLTERFMFCALSDFISLSVSECETYVRN